MDHIMMLSVVRRLLLVSMVGCMVLPAVEPALAKSKGKHPAYWRRNPNRWKPQNWSPVQRHNHWNRPCAGLGCDPGIWAKPAYRNAGRGWYNSSTYRNWGWWGSRSAAWEYGALAAGALIGTAIASAQRSQVPTITVPDSSYQLNYRSVQAETDNGIRFLVQRDGVTYQMDADCRDGELNGYAPNTPAEAQLLNAACQIAYGT